MTSTDKTACFGGNKRQEESSFIRHIHGPPHFFFFPFPLIVSYIPWNLCTRCDNSSVQWTVEDPSRESFQFFMVILVFLLFLKPQCLISLRQAVYKLLGLLDFPPFQLREFCLGYVLHSPPTHNSFLSKTFSLPSVLLTFLYFQILSFQWDFFSCFPSLHASDYHCPLLSQGLKVFLGTR